MIEASLPQLRIAELSQILGIPQITIANDIETDIEIEDIEEAECNQLKKSCVYQ